MYLVWGLNYLSAKIPLEEVVPRVENIEHHIRVAMLAAGGSLSHHHGIGKLKKKDLELVLSSAGIKYLQAMKKAIDPTNIFGA